MADKKSKKRRPARRKKRSPAKNKPEIPRDAATRAEVLTGYALTDDVIESALLSGEHAGALEDYFGVEEYRELRNLSQEAASRKVRGGPRVLILPGIMGSRIGRIRPHFFDDVIWLDPIDIFTGRLRELRLNGEASDLKPLGVISFAYSKLKLRLTNAGYDVDCHPYDWRKSLQVLGRELAARLRKEKNDKVHLVAHSMGGLVARSAIAQGAPKIGRLVMLGTPNYGSFVPVQALRAVYPVVRKIAFADTHHSAEQLASEIFNTFPGLYQMLPWSEKFDDIDLYDLKNWPTEGPAPLQRLLGSVEAVQKSLAPPDDRFCLIAGVNEETVVSISKDGDEFRYDCSFEGDGTVPLVLAELPHIKTYYIEEKHGSLPNNRIVAKAVDDILASGATSKLPDHWVPSRRGVCKTIRDQDLKEAAYEGNRGRSLSRREQRYLLEELVSPAAREEEVLTSVCPPGIGAAPREGYEQEFQRIVIGRIRQHRIEIRLALGSITDVDVRANVLGMFRDVTPSGPLRAVDALLEGAISEFVTRRMFTANVGEISIVPSGRHLLRADLVAFAGLGPFDRFNTEALELVAENVIRTFLKTKVDDFATVLFGVSSGLDVATSLRHMLQGFIRGLCDADTDHRFHGITFCETDRERYNIVKQELYRLASTPLFHHIEVTIDEIELPPSAEQRIFGVRAPAVPEPLYLIIRNQRPSDSVLTFESSLLTIGSKATVLKGVKETPTRSLQSLLKRIETNRFTFGGLEQFGQQLAELVLQTNIVDALARFREEHLVVVHDAESSKIPWETLNVNAHFPALEGGLSRRYVADNLSVAKWLEQRRHDPTLDVLLIVDPTENLSGAVQEGKRIQELFGGSSSSINLDVLKGAQARKKDLLERFASGKYDVVHYAGHAFFDSTNPARSGILCHRNEVLSGADLAGVGNLPSLMFFNACEAGRIRTAKERKNTELDMHKRIERNVGLAEAFLRGGVANYVGTYWPVGDSSAKEFAATFYDNLIKGRSLGEALRGGRKVVQESESVDWADYILYGTQDFVLKVR